MTRTPAQRDLTAEAARDLTDRIVADTAAVLDLVQTAWEGGAHRALGYGSWAAYCRAELVDVHRVRLDRAERRDAVEGMSEAGMSQREISTGLGIGLATVNRDLTGSTGEVAVPGGTPAHLTVAAIEAEVDRAPEAWTALASGVPHRLSPQLDAAIAAVERGEADGLVVQALDRVSRSVLDFATLIARANDGGWNLVILDRNLDLTTPTGRFTASILSAVAELEREMTRDRTVRALAAARARGVQLGRPKEVPDAVVARIKAERAAGRQYKDILAGLEADGVPAPRGGTRWHMTTVARIARAAA